MFFFFFQKMFQNPQIRQMNYLKMFRKKSLSDELFHHFSSKVQNLTRVFNYLHDSHSIFRARRINSEWVFGRTVHHWCWKNVDDYWNVDGERIIRCMDRFHMTHCIERKAT